MTVAVWDALRRRPVRFLFSRWPLRCAAFLCTGAALGCAVLAVLAALLAVGIGLTVVGVGVLVLMAAAACGVPVAAVERRRLRLVEPEPLPDPHGSLPGVGALPWLRARLKERATWRELGYALLLAVVFTAAGLGFTALLGFSALLVSAPVFAWLIAPDTMMIVPGRSISGPVAALPAAAAGLAGLAVCAYLGGLLVAAQVRVALALLPAVEEDLGTRVVELTRSRVRLVDAFEAERRRIERDLHDGAQQQLVALTMTLGLAELELRGQDPAATPASSGAPATSAASAAPATSAASAASAVELVARARGEARLALDQLRGLVRGIRPQVLADHGLAAATSEVALRHPVPVTVDIDLPHRLPDAVETVAYFTVTEALTNAAKHSGAAAVIVAARLAGDLLTVTVTDDGRGGADPAAGAGLQGLADRVAVLHGRLKVTSPAGGPTRLTLEVPCCA